MHWDRQSTYTCEELTRGWLAVESEEIHALGNLEQKVLGQDCFKTQVYFLDLKKKKKKIDLTQALGSNSF